VPHTQNASIQKTKMRIERLIPLCFLVISCSSSEYIDNQKMKDAIDSLEISKIITEVEIDSIGNILDTLSIEYLKYDVKNRKRFKQHIYWNQDRKMSWIDYFKPDEDLFYRESFDEKDKSNSIFEAKSLIGGNIKKVMQISKDRTPFDTIHMEYSYRFHSNGKIKQLLIKTTHKEVDGFISKLIYDKYEKPLFEMTIWNNDTMSFQAWEYIDTMLQKCIYTDYQRDTSKSVYYFKGKKMLTKEEAFKFSDGHFIQTKEINHFYNEANKRTKSVEKNQETKEVKYVKYFEEI